MPLAFQMEVVYSRVWESLSTSVAIIIRCKKSGFCCGLSIFSIFLFLNIFLITNLVVFCRLFPIYFGNLVFPAKQASLVPFTLKHLFCLGNNLLEVHQRFGSLEKVLKVFDKIVQVLRILIRLLDIERNYVEFVEILQPWKVIVALNQAQFPQFV